MNGVFSFTFGRCSSTLQGCPEKAKCIKNNTFSVNELAQSTIKGASIGALVGGAIGTVGLGAATSLSYVMILIVIAVCIFVTFPVSLALINCMAEAQGLTMSNYLYLSMQQEGIALAHNTLKIISKIALPLTVAGGIVGGIVGAGYYGYQFFKK